MENVGISFDCEGKLGSSRCDLLCTLCGAFRKLMCWHCVNVLVLGYFYVNHLLAVCILCFIEMNIRLKVRGINVELLPYNFRIFGFSAMWLRADDSHVRARTHKHTQKQGEASLGNGTNDKLAG